MTTIQHKVLFVDDEPQMLDAIRRTVGRRYIVHTAQGGAPGIALLASQSPFAVVVSDMQMPGMSGLQFIKSARAEWADPSYIMLTGNADQQTAVDAVNQGQIFRFLNKPCSGDTLLQAIAAGVKQYELVMAERTLLRETMSGSVRLLTEALAVADPHLGGYIADVRKDMLVLAKSIGVHTDWRVCLAASLGMLGMIAVQTDNPAENFSEESLACCAACGSQLIKNIPRLEPLVRVLAEQRKNVPWPNVIDTNDADAMERLTARLLSVAVNLQRSRLGLISRNEVLSAIASLDTPYAPPLARTLECVVDEGIEQQKKQDPIGAESSAKPNQLLPFTIGSLSPGDRLAADIYSIHGKLLLSKGVELSGVIIERLRHLASKNALAGVTTSAEKSGEAGRLPIAA